MSKALRVLQVEDSESDAALIVRLLEKSGYLVRAQRVESEERLRQALAREDWDVLIADDQLPRLDAAGALRVLHESGPDIPFIVVSGTIVEDRAVELIKAGAHDYVLKDHIARLVPTVQREMREAQSRRERLRVQEDLRDREEWLALVVDATHLAMFDFYPQTGKLTWTGDVRRHFGLPPDAEVTDETFLRGLHPADRERIESLIRKAHDPASGGEYAADYRIIGLTDHVERWISAHGRVFFDPEGKAVRFVGVTTDITERKRLEQQFRQSQKLESIGLLAGGVAHDFNNILTVITGFSQMALDEFPLFHPVRANLVEVLKAAARGASLTQQLLAFSRNQASHTEIIGLNNFVASIQNMLSRLIGADMNLTVHLDPAAGSICADAGHLEQVIMNLVVNARDAMPNGGKLEIGTGHLNLAGQSASHPEMAPGDYAAFTVSDTGTGMSPEVKAHIFDPFFTTKERGKGTGLGLSTVYGLVKQYDGAISVDSEVGRGTRFTILFPAVDPPTGAVAASPAVSPPLGTETIVLAENEPGVRRLVQMTLEHSGYHVMACSTGLEAIECSRQHPSPIHLLFTDAVLPDMGGAELVAQFAVCRPGVPVLCMYSDSGLLWPTAIEGNSLQKPFNTALLLARIRAVLDEFPAPAETAA